MSITLPSFSELPFVVLFYVSKLFSLSWISTFLLYFFHEDILAKCSMDTITSR